MGTEMVQLVDKRIQRIENSIRRQAIIKAKGWQPLDMLTYMANQHIPGASVAVIDEGWIAWAKGYGVLEAGKDTQVSLETRFQAASISKPVAALTALSLVQEGKLSLDEDIHTYQTTWSLPENDGWQPRVTVRQLLSHSAGITVEGFPGYSPSIPIPTLFEILKGEKPANTGPIVVDTLPGLQFRYSGGGYTILQQLIEDICGEPFWKIAKVRVLDPAGMEHSTYQCPLPDAWQPAAATGHRSDGEPLQGKWHLYPESAAAGLWTTPLDLARLIILLEKTLQGSEEKIISQSLLKEMLTPQVKVREIGLNGWEGIGLFLTVEEQSEWYFGHGGSNEGFRCQFIARKGKGQAAVIMTNSDQGDVLAEDWMNTVALEYGWPGFAWVPPEPVNLEPEAFEKYAGKYQLENNCVLQVRGNQDGLELLVDEQSPLTMKPRSAETFFLTQINAEVRFMLEEEHCIGLILKQNGQDMPAIAIL